MWCSVVSGFGVIMFPKVKPITTVIKMPALKDITNIMMKVPSDIIAKKISESLILRTNG